MTLSTAPNDHHTDVNHERTSTTEGHLAHHDDEPVLNTPMIAANNNVIRPQYEYDYAFVKKDRSDSQGSHGSHDHESGLKKVWHKVSDKVHPYNTAVEVGAYISVYGQP
jgi:hypothetical protein